MVNDTGTVGVPGEAGGTPPMSFVQRLFGVYFEPKKTFEDINRKGTWMGMFIVLAVLGMAMAYVINVRVDRETRIRQGLEMSPIKLSEEQKETAVQQALSRPPGVTERFGFVAAPITILIFYAILAAAFLLVFVLMGAGITFKKSWTTSIWAMGPPSILLSLISLVLMYVKDPDKLQLDPTSNVASNLGFLISDQKAQPVLASFLSSIDIFSLWNIVLLSIGFAAASEHRVTTKKAAIGVIVLWAIWVLGKAGWKAI